MWWGDVLLVVFFFFFNACAIGLCSLNVDLTRVGTPTTDHCEPMPVLMCPRPISHIQPLRVTFHRF